MASVTPLAVAIFFQNLVAIDELMYLGCNPNFQEEHSLIAPLHMACYLGKIEVVGLLLESESIRIERHALAADWLANMRSTLLLTCTALTKEGKNDNILLLIVPPFSTRFHLIRLLNQGRSIHLSAQKSIQTNEWVCFPLGLLDSFLSASAPAVARFCAAYRPTCPPWEAFAYREKLTSGKRFVAGRIDSHSKNVVREENNGKRQGIGERLWSRKRRHDADRCALSRRLAVSLLL